MTTKDNKKRINAGSVLLTVQQRDALKNCASNNARKITDQIYFFVVDGLTREGYLVSEK